MPSRSVFYNMTLIQDFLAFSRLLYSDADLISLEQEFEHKYLWKTPSAFGFSSGFIVRIKVLYCNALH